MGYKAAVRRSLGAFALFWLLFGPAWAVPEARRRSWLTGLVAAPGAAQAEVIEAWRCFQQVSPCPGPLFPGLEEEEEVALAAMTWKKVERERCLPTIVDGYRSLEKAGTRASFSLQLPSKEKEK